MVKKCFYSGLSDSLCPCFLFLQCLTFPSLFMQVLEFDLKGSPLDASSFIDVVVKDFETIGKDK